MTTLSPYNLLIRTGSVFLDRMSTMHNRPGLLPHELLQILLRSRSLPGGAGRFPSPERLTSDHGPSGRAPGPVGIGHPGLYVIKEELDLVQVLRIYA